MSEWITYSYNKSFCNQPSNTMDLKDNYPKHNIRLHGISQ